MARLTKSGIEALLLAGQSVGWRDHNNKADSLALADAKQRRLFRYLLHSTVREPTQLPQTFITGLQAAYDAIDDPATGTATQAGGSGASNGPWRLHSIRTEGFGGLNSWQGSPFVLQLDGESLLVDGPNGSGKSSLIGAIAWALTGERPRDQADANAHSLQPVLLSDGSKAGEWPPIASYPPSAADLNSTPDVRVELEFRDPAGSSATVVRTLSGGQVIDPAFLVDGVIIEAGILMPTRLSKLRFDDGGSYLTTAVKALTGLDDLIAIGTLVEGLCHKAREYRSYKSKEYAASKSAFEQALIQARTVLEEVGVKVRDFTPADTDDPVGSMASFAKELVEKAAQLASVISTDLDPSIELANAAHQRRVIAAIENARLDVEGGPSSLATWKMLALINSSISPEALDDMRAALTATADEIAEAVDLVRRAAADPKFQLKALAAQWHRKHGSGPIEACPLCEQSLKTQPSLAAELEALRLAGDGAARTFEDNVAVISARLEANIPGPLRSLTAEQINQEPRAALVDELTSKFVSDERYANCLKKFGSLVEAALSTAPGSLLQLASLELADDDPPVLTALRSRMNAVEHIIQLKGWFEREEAAWLQWWQDLSRPTPLLVVIPEEGATSESLSDHLARLSDALSKAEPYRKAAEYFRSAWTVGREAYGLQKEIAKRDAIADSLAPLKGLGSLADATARDAINGLSDRIAKMLQGFHLTDQLKFVGAHLRKKEGLSVRGGIADELVIDATLVANTSWLRAVLWCFLFSLREEAVEQLGHDPMPLMTFDDPQSTFDIFHRARWARHIAGMQGGTPPLQVLIASYDDQFLELIKVDGVAGREALLAAPSDAVDHVSILEGAAIDREWAAASAANTPSAAVAYIARVRVHVEGLLKLMLRGEDAQIRTMVLGGLRDLLDRLHNQAKAPWDRPPFKALLKLLEKSRAEIKYLEGSHHTTGQNYGFVEANEVEKGWRSGLKSALERAFRAAREHRLLHGQLTALHAPTPTASFPDGYQAKVKTIPLNVLGRAAALTSGRAADGSVQMAMNAPQARPIVLGQHHAFRLAASTLEPVARPGDILIVKEQGDPPPRSLVVALSDDRVLARRLEVSDNMSDVAVLTAQSINPHRLEAPVVAHRGTLSLKKVVGVLYDGAAAVQASSDEVCDCGGESSIHHLTVDALGLVEVAGASAEPYALDGQFLVVRQPVSKAEEVRRLDGQPVIAADAGGNHYFKRLRVLGQDTVVLESLDTGGEFPPILLSLRQNEADSLASVWPVAGVLFEFG